MVNVAFDGNKEAERMAEFLEENERVLGKSLLILQCDGLGEESFYVRLKREMGERLGVLVSVVHAGDKEELKNLILEANGDETVDGILVQLPVAEASKEEVGQILSLIKADKDVDGLNPVSRFEPAVVRAVERVLDIFRPDESDKIALVGAKGEVGTRLGKRLTKLGYEFSGFDKEDDLKELTNFDVIIAATGVKGIIDEEMVKNGFVGLDLGYPGADISPAATKKASLFTPVPGGIGPMTVVALYENLGDAV